MRQTVRKPAANAFSVGASLVDARSACVAGERQAGVGKRRPYDRSSDHTAQPCRETFVLVVDVGNTRVKAALATLSGRMIRCVSVGHEVRSVSALAKVVTRLMGRRAVAGAVLCSVVPAANRPWVRALVQAGAGQPVVVRYIRQLGVAVDYPRPASIGADRLADAAEVAGRGTVPAIVADFGTALTFDVIVRRRGKATYIGGAICPGLNVMVDYLADRTALLPRITLAGPMGAVGRSTRAAMRLGARVGYRGMVREVTDHIRRSLKLGAVKLYATGGGAAWALKGSGLPFEIDPDLTLKGLVRIYRLNRRES